jgi:ribosomal biogenesis protein LAS1
MPFSMMMPRAIPSSLFGRLIPLLSVGEYHRLYFPYFFFVESMKIHLFQHITDTTYSFVTGLVDTKIHGVRRTMFQRAMDLGLPASFVELRHEATHREPPSLVVLRKAAQRSLEWLWDNYWAGIADASYAPVLDHDDGASVKAALEDALQPLCGADAGGQAVSKKRKRDFGVSVAMQLVSICNVSAGAVRLLSEVLLERGVLVPAGRK